MHKRSVCRNLEKWHKKVGEAVAGASLDSTRMSGEHVQSSTPYPGLYIAGRHAPNPSVREYQ